ncbi:MAG: hypothetical protein Edafosvirus5_68 [Edafosvirus sp.]|uniref:Uncharacterized protein n=1 Tax=Edafosvirus sp. TaxID=2487765 RepID=A0A3G4ZTD1_9VIRU|nr:MAG: hypothetical protein Edafosvirus5_68 [Edafosvirus sp.]
MASTVESELVKITKRINEIEILRAPLNAKLGEIRQLLEQYDTELKTLIRNEMEIKQEIEIKKNINDGYVYDVNLYINADFIQSEYEKADFFSIQYEVENVMKYFELSGKITYNITQDDSLKCTIKLYKPWKLPKEKSKHMFTSNGKILATVEIEKLEEDDTVPLDLKEYLEWKYPHENIDEKIQNVFYKYAHGKIDHGCCPLKDTCCMGCGYPLPTYKYEDDLFITFKNSGWSFCYENGRFNPNRDCVSKIVTKLKSIGFSVPRIFIGLASVRY